MMMKIFEFTHYICTVWVPLKDPVAHPRTQTRKLQSVHVRPRCTRWCRERELSLCLSLSLSLFLSLTRETLPFSLLALSLVRFGPEDRRQIDRTIFLLRVFRGGHLIYSTGYTYRWEQGPSYCRLSRFLDTANSPSSFSFSPSIYTHRISPCNRFSSIPLI